MTSYYNQPFDPNRSPGVASWIPQAGNAIGGFFSNLGSAAHNAVDAINPANPANQTPADAAQQASNQAGINAGTAYLQNLQTLAPNMAQLQMGQQFNQGYGVDQKIGDVAKNFAPQLSQAGGVQAGALSQLQNAAQGNGPSLAALQQQAGLQNAMQAGAAQGAVDPRRTGGSAATQFLNSLGAQNNVASQAVNQAASGRLGEQTSALGGANSLAGAYTGNLVNAAALNTNNAAALANAYNNTTGLQNIQNINSQNLGTDYLAGLGNVATKGTSSALTADQNSNNFNAAVVNGLGNGVATYLRTQTPGQ